MNKSLLEIIFVQITGSSFVQANVKRKLRSKITFMTGHQSKVQLDHDLITCLASLIE